MKLISITCPDCHGRSIGSVEESKREGLVVKARVRGLPPTQLLRLPEVREHKARFGHVPDTRHFVTVPVQLGDAPTTDVPVAFECPRHGYFELPVEALRNAVLRARAEGKTWYLPAQAPPGTGRCWTEVIRQGGPPWRT
jgi:hypothetical protein